jgi:hypothetical protein
MKRLLGCAAVGFGAAVASFATPASAVYIDLTATSDQTQTTGVAFDSKGFEADTAGSQPDNALLSPAGATWEFQTSAGNPITVLTGATAGGGPAGAYSGAKYLQIARTTAQTSLNARFDRDIHPATDAFTLSLAVWVGSFTNDATANDPYAVFTLQPDNGTTPQTTTQLAGFGFRYSSTGAKEVFRYNATPSTEIVAGQTFNTGAWNTLEFTWDPSQAAGNRGLLSINDGAAFNVQMPTAGVIATIRQFKMLTNLNNATDTARAATYVDAIPEPSSLALIGVGAAAMLRRRRRASGI